MLNEATAYIGMSEDQFMMMHASYMQNPMTQQVLMQAQFAPPGGDPAKKPNLSRQKTKDLFKQSEVKKMESMKKLMVAQMSGGGSQEDPMAQMVEMMVEQSKLSDEMFFEHGVDEDEFNFAMMHYNLMNDPEIKAEMMKNMQQMGGMPGMGGM